MVMIGDALRQAFMPKHEYESLREEDKAWQKLQMPFISIVLVLISLAVFIPTVITLKIVFPDNNLRRPFCRDLRIQPLSVNFTTTEVTGRGGSESDLPAGAFVLTDQETVDYYWMVAFVPSAMIFAVSVVYLIAGIAVVYTSPARHGCLKVVENNYCASRMGMFSSHAVSTYQLLSASLLPLLFGGVHCLSILNFVFAFIFGLLSLFLGSTLLTLGSSCSLPLFWCYEISSWSLVLLHGGTAFFLRRKAASILDDADYAGRNIRVIEMLEANPAEVRPDMERRVNEGFKSWMGPSFLSSDDDEEEDEHGNYQEVPSTTPLYSTRQRI